MKTTRLAAGGVLAGAACFVFGPNVAAGAENWSGEITNVASSHGGEEKPYYDDILANAFDYYGAPYNVDIGAVTCTEDVNYLDDDVSVSGGQPPVPGTQRLATLPTFAANDSFCWKVRLRTPGRAGPNTFFGTHYSY